MNEADQAIKDDSDIPVEFTEVLEQFGKEMVAWLEADYQEFLDKQNNETP